jgi:hypothetical protein
VVAKFLKGFKAVNSSASSDKSGANKFNLWGEATACGMATIPVLESPGISVYILIIFVPSVNLILVFVRYQKAPKSDIFSYRTLVTSCNIEGVRAGVILMFQSPE